MQDNNLHDSSDLMYSQQLLPFETQTGKGIMHRLKGSYIFLFYFEFLEDWTDH